MKYSKPKVVAQNKTEGSYAAGCSANNKSNQLPCGDCERRK